MRRFIEGENGEQIEITAMEDTTPDDFCEKCHGSSEDQWGNACEGCGGRGIKLSEEQVTKQHAPQASPKSREVLPVLAACSIRPRRSTCATTLQETQEEMDVKIGRLINEMTASTKAFSDGLARAAEALEAFRREFGDIASDPSDWWKRGDEPPEWKPLESME